MRLLLLQKKKKKCDHWIFTRLIWFKMFFLPAHIPAFFFFFWQRDYVHKDHKSWKKCSYFLSERFNFLNCKPKDIKNKWILMQDIKTHTHTDRIFKLNGIELSTDCWESQSRLETVELIPKTKIWVWRWG